ncbi:phosphoribosyltransferase [Desulforamulus reducens MI-1]|uniref:Phosphoribosyltransferase n=1 Tax=Desulforamulus reducens (strain ATCC BAA-1160 / DSM 100696 / MI-1) TaxID=349161 RepID=A4J930_DESRM|nr:ComF family protein [Desulforamulus reducens]ABO51583.1 phosphoribosyltransferase [Desulforamulus reducens MI-1]
MHFLLEALLNLLFPLPPGCQLCGRTGDWDICPTCSHWLVQWEGKPKCQICGRSLAYPGVLCQECQHRQPPFVQARAVGPYEGGLRDAIHLLKYKGRKTLVPLLGKLMLELLQRQPELLRAELVVPIPMSPGRRRQRGFNQAELLAREVARGLQLPLMSNVLTKPKETPPQTGLDKNQRRENLRGAFDVNTPEAIKGKAILIVDDVFTTGSTMAEVAETLHKKGAGKLYVITLANAGK